MATLEDMAALLQAGLGSKIQEDDFWNHARSVCLSLAAEYAKDGRIRWPDKDDLVQQTLVSASDTLMEWDPAKGKFTTFLRKLMLTETRKIQSGYRRETKSMVAAVERAWDRIQASPEIASNPDALAEWDEQIGRWMCDGIMPDRAALAKLRHDLITSYRLFGKWRQGNGH